MKILFSCTKFATFGKNACLLSDLVTCYTMGKILNVKTKHAKNETLAEEEACKKFARKTMNISINWKNLVQIHFIVN